jgi:regulator of protease activity HflC (stomatin/prohibitin superfamily)
MSQTFEEHPAQTQSSFHGRWQEPPRTGNRKFGGGSWSWGRRLVALVLAVAVGYLLYFWEVRRTVVTQGHVLILLKKNGTRSLPGDQIVIPREPKIGTPEHDQWTKQFGDCNGIKEEIYPEGTYFFSPFDYERTVIDISKPKTGAIVPADMVGIVIKKFGNPLDPGQVLADPKRDQRGPLPIVLRPGRYNEYANPYAYEIKQVAPLVIDPGFRGVVTIMAGKPAANPNEYLVGQGEQGTQPIAEPEGFRYVNPFEKRITPISILSQKFAMADKDAITFPSADSFDIRLDGFVEWSIDPQALPLIYVQYGEGNGLIPYLEEKVILPYARSFCRLVGSQYNARDFISGDTKLKFQQEFEQRLQAACRKEGIVVRQALVRNIEPPDAIKQPINEREIAKEQILQFEQQIKVAKSMATLTAQQEMAKQNQAIGQMTADVVGITKKAEQEQDVAVTKAEQDLAVAKLRLQAAQKEADALISRGQAEADVILLNKQAEAEPLRKQINAFGDGETYARYFFYQKVAPSMKSILTTTDGPFADIFKQFAAPPRPTTNPSASPRLTSMGQ